MNYFVAPRWAETWNKSLWWYMANIDDSKHSKNKPRDFCTFWRHTVVYSTLVFIVISIIALWITLVISFIIATFILDPVNSFSVLASAIIGVMVFACFGYSWPYIWKFLEYLKISTGLYYVFGVPFKYVIAKPIVYVFNQIVLLFGMAWEKLPKLKQVDTSEKLPPKEPSMLIQYYRALKDKYCPIMEYS